ncbi:response regulator transcription factor [Patulibacter sp. NPDC049589]|uniref:response regulator transcription factor n=1 Tax=Patulibacter sp. NPDC049589 TaxID=3154731 RepID=UPI003426F544
MRVLVAEDHERVADAVARGLRRSGLAVDIAADGDAALYKARVNPYDVIVLDRDLPRTHGDEVCRTLNAEQPGTKILMLTAAGALDDMVEGLALGADDYMSKPFRFAELAARVDALGRRSGRVRPSVLRHDDVELDPARHVASRAGQDLELSPKEFGVLQELLAADGQVVTTEQLLERVWDENVDPFTNTVRMVLVTLRRKLGEPGVIQTVRGAGYRI